MTKSRVFAGRTLRLVSAAAFLACTASAPATDVGVSISLGQPGFYGQINLGNVAPPQLLYPQPVIIAPRPVALPPIYLRVPPGHAMHWEKHCYQYNACDRQVYFVQDRWYNDVYVPYYRDQHGRGGEHRGSEDDRGDYRGSEGERGRGHHGHGRGHDRD
jgi:hypothetical protein